MITLAVLVFCTGSSVTFADIGGMRAAVGGWRSADGQHRHPAAAGLAGEQARQRAGAAGRALAAGAAPVEVLGGTDGMAGGEVVVVGAC